jgi:hypothetical protein
VAKVYAKRWFCLRDEELQGLLHCADVNPVDPAFTAMHLYRKGDVRRAALRKFGSFEAVEAERRRRLCR